MAALPVNNYSSKGVPFWQPYGTGAGSVSTLNTASISSLTVSSINGLPADNIDTAAWSFFPAAYDVDMSNYSILNATQVLNNNDITIGTVNSNTIGFTSGGNTLAYINNSNFVSLVPISATADIATSALQANIIRTSNILAPAGSISTLNSLNVNARNIQASTITAQSITAISTIHVISTISSAVLEIRDIEGLSTINGAPYIAPDTENWANYPAVSTVNMAGNSLGDVANVSSLALNVWGTNQVGSVKYDGAGDLAAVANYTTQAAAGNNLAGQRLKANTSPSTFIQTTDNVFQNGMFYEKTFEIDGVDYATQTATSSLGGWQFTDKAGNNYTMAGGNFTAPVISTVTLNVSSINGAELSGGSGGGIIVSSMFATALSTIGASIAQGLMSSIVFNPSINPQFNIDLGMGNFLTTLGTGLFGVAVAVPTTAGTITYGITKGLASLFEPKPVNNITNNEFEVYNYQTQLQTSTLGNQISSIYTFLSTIPSTVLINDQPTFSTVSEINIPVFVSTISGSNPTCIRSIADPTQTISTPWTYNQGFGQWVEIPSGGGGGISTNISTLGLSTLSLLPSTVLKGDLDGAILQVLESATGNYGEVQSAGYWTSLSPTDPNFGIYARNSSNRAVWIDSNISANVIVLEGKTASFPSISFPQLNANKSTITNLVIDQGPEPSITYGNYPPGFPSTIAAQIKFQSSIGGYGGVQILSQLGEAKSLTVNGSGVFASDIITGSNSDYPLLVQVPDLDQWVLLGISTLGGGVGKSEILNTIGTNQGQLVIAAPNTSNGSSTRIMFLDSASTCVGINNPAPQAQLDVGTGLNYTSPGSVAIFGGNKDGTLEVTLQNQSAGSNASAFFFAVENTGGEYAGFGINSSNLAPLNNTVTEIPGASIQSGTIDIVIAPQSDHSSNAGIFLGYNDATFAHHINSNGALSFNASYNGTINPGNFGTSGSILTTNGSGAPPSWNNSANLVNLNVSSLTVGSNITWPETSFAAPKVFLQGGLSNSPVINTNVIASPYVDTLTFYKGFTNQDFPGGYICLAADNGLMGVNKIPQANIDLDVNGTICASNISTTQISTNLEFVSSLQATNISTTLFTAGSAAISSIREPIQTEAVPYSTCGLIAAQNWDFFVGSWGVYPGRQPVQGGYFITTSNATTGGNGYGVFMFPPPGLSSLQTISGTYFTNSSNPGINTPIWVGNGAPGVNGNFSTINVYGDVGRDIFVSYLGYV